MRLVGERLRPDFRNRHCRRDGFGIDREADDRRFALCVTGVTLSSAIVAYGFAKIRFRGRGALFAIMLGTMMVPFPVIMVPLFCIFRLF